MRKRKEEYTNLHENPKIGKKNVIKKRKDNLVILKIGSVVY